MSDLEAAFAFHWRCRYPEEPEPAREFQFAAPLRRWRFDFAFLQERVAVEIEGGIWTGGAHTRGKHFTSDCEKYNAAAIRGWCVLRFTADQVKSGYAVELVMTALREAREPVLRKVEPEQPQSRKRKRR